MTKEKVVLCSSITLQMEQRATARAAEFKSLMDVLGILPPDHEAREVTGQTCSHHSRSSRITISASFTLAPHDDQYYWMTTTKNMLVL